MHYFFTDVPKGRRINEAFKKRNATQNVLFGKKQLKLVRNCKDVNLRLKNVVRLLTDQFQNEIFSLMMFFYTQHP